MKEQEGRQAYEQRGLRFFNFLFLYRNRYTNTNELHMNKGEIRDLRHLMEGAESAPQQKTERYLCVPMAWCNKQDESA